MDEAANQSEKGTKRRRNPGGRAASRFEALSYRFVSPASPFGVARLINRLSVWLHRLGLQAPLKRPTLVLITKGRKTGCPRVTPLECSYWADSGVYTVCAGWGERCRWYLNLLRDPNVEVRIGQRKFRAVAEKAPDERAFQIHVEYLRLNPRAAYTWPELTGVPFDGSDAAIWELVRRAPIILLRPEQ